VDKSNKNYGRLSQEALEELKQIHFKETGKWLTDDEALTMAGDLFRFYKAVFRKKRR